MTASSNAGVVASPDELETFVTAHPHIAFFDILYTGLSGVPRGKRLRQSEMAAVYAQGRFLPGSIQVVDITGRDVEETGMVWGDGDADRLARPVPGGIVPAPWLGDDVAQVLTSLHELDGRWCELDPRAILGRVLDRYAADGMTPVVACELEYYLADARRPRNGGLSLPRGASSGRRPDMTEVYGLPQIEEAAPFLRDLWLACDAQGIPLEGVISECSPGQIELTLRHKSDALRAADDAILYKRAAKGVARRHACTATFMAKPWSDRAGSGLHVHTSINDVNGVNLMASDDPAGSALLRHAIGGMAKLAPESMAIFAPNQNSYRRFRAHSYAPVTSNWGVNNRTVAMRVPAGVPASRHIEHRLAGADANPYLALATVLAAGHHGIYHSIDPGAPVEGNGYAPTGQEPAPDAILPTNWFDAIARFERSTVLRDYLGDRFVDMYTVVKRTEQARFFEVVTELDYDWYLDNA